MPKLNNIDQIRSVEWSRRYLWDISFEEVAGGLVEAVTQKVGDIALGKLEGIADQLLGKEGAIPSAGSNFEWYPITKFSDEETSITHFEAPGTYYNHPVPKGSKILGINITFVDDIHNSMFNWCKAWMNPFTEVEGNTILEKAVGAGLTDKGRSSLNVVTNDKGIDEITDKSRCIKTISEVSKIIVVSKLDNQLNSITTNRYVVIPDGTLSFVGDSDDGLHTYDLKMLKVQVLETVAGFTMPRFDIITKKTAGVVRRFT